MEKRRLASPDQLVFGPLCVTCKPPPLEETLLLAGSSTMKLYLEPVVTAFAAKNPRASIVCEGGGAGGRRQSPA